MIRWLLRRLRPDVRALEAAHTECAGHRVPLLAAEGCLCFYCRASFPSGEIDEWCDEDESGQGRTALCPRCGIDAVIPWKPGRDGAFLERMHRHWFQRSRRLRG